MENTEQVKTKQIVYWSDGYFIADDDAIEQAEILDSVNAFGGQHGILEVPEEASIEAIETLVRQELKLAA